MCLAIPARIVSIDGFEAGVEIGGVGRTISVVLTPEAEVGDYVYVHTGYAISVVDKAEALESLCLLQELAATYPADELFHVTGFLEQVLAPEQAKHDFVSTQGAGFGD